MRRCFGAPRSCAWLSPKTLKLKKAAKKNCGRFKKRSTATHAMVNTPAATLTRTSDCFDGIETLDPLKSSPGGRENPGCFQEMDYVIRNARRAFSVSPLRCHPSQDFDFLE
jgi:hypothetical protein